MKKSDLDSAMARVVVVDTNQITSVDWRLEKQMWQRLLRLNRQNEICLIVPEIVIAEVLGKFRRDCEAAVQSLRRIHVEAPAVEAATIAFEEHLRGVLNDARVKTPEPVVDVLELVRRATARTAPFDDNGRNFRDSVIWMHVLAEAGEGEAVLVSDDSDFYEGKTDQLKGSLVSQTSEPVGAFRSIAGFLEHVGRQPLGDKLASEVAAALRDPSEYLVLKQDVESRARREVVQVDDNAWDVSIHAVRNLDSIAAVGLRSKEGASGSETIELSASADVAVVVQYQDGERTVRNTSGEIQGLELAVDAVLVDGQLVVESIATVPVRESQISFLASPHVAADNRLVEIDDETLRAIRAFLRKSGHLSMAAVRARLADQIEPIQDQVDEILRKSGHLSMAAVRARLAEQIEPIQDQIRDLALSANEDVLDSMAAAVSDAVQRSAEAEPPETEDANESE